MHGPGVSTYSAEAVSRDSLNVLSVHMIELQDIFDRQLHQVYAWWISDGTAGRFNAVRFLRLPLLDKTLDNLAVV